MVQKSRSFIRSLPQDVSFFWGVALPVVIIAMAVLNIWHYAFSVFALAIWISLVFGFVLTKHEHEVRGPGLSHALDARNGRIVKIGFWLLLTAVLALIWQVVTFWMLLLGICVMFYGIGSISYTIYLSPP